MKIKSSKQNIKKRREPRELKPMLPSLTFDSPEHSDWLYEVKYDGFRAIIDWDENGIRLTSRNEKSLLTQFPEIEEFLLHFAKRIQQFLPLKLDSELVFLENPYKANFGALQTRGRLRSKEKINDLADHSPCRIMVFDILNMAGKNLQKVPFRDRKEKLINFFNSLDFSLTPDPNNGQLLNSLKHIPCFLIYGKKLFYTMEKALLQNIKLVSGKKENGHRFGSNIKIGNTLVVL
jgi:bifunctional non-homologous end joining protein LigD